MKRLLSLAIAVCMLIGIVAVAPISVGAVETQKVTTGATSGDYEYELLDDGTAEISRYTGSETSITIPSQIDGYTVTTIGFESFEYCESLTSITIPDCVTTIGYCAFYSCISLTNITIPDSVTTIGGSAFEYCISLTSITIPDSVTSIGYDAFYDTEWYNNQPDGLVYAGKVAYKYKGECSSEVIIKDGTKGIADGSFCDCTSLTSITIPDSVTTIGGWSFSGCTSLTSITIPDSVTTIGDNAFYYCESLTSITIGNGVTTIGHSAFRYCKSLTSITIPDSVTTIGDSAFEDCTSLTNITIPYSVTSIGDYAFGYYDLDSLGYVKIKNFIIYGYPDSTAEEYANNNGFAFLNFSEIPTTSSTEPTTTIPSTTEPTTTVPSTTEPTTTQPTTTEPSTTNPSTTNPTTTVPSTPKPVPTQPATVKKTTVTLAKSSATVYRTGKTTIKATVKNGKGKTTYKSSNTKIAKVTSNGVVTGVSKGTARITVTNNGVKKVFTVKVNNPTLNKNSVSIKKGKTFTLKIAGKIGTAKFTSSNKKIATVNAKGKITAKKKGTVTIKVKTNGITLVCKVKVK